MCLTFRLLLISFPECSTLAMASRVPQSFVDYSGMESTREAVKRSGQATRLKRFFLAESVFETVLYSNFSALKNIFDRVVLVENYYPVYPEILI